MAPEYRDVSQKARQHVYADRPECIALDPEQTTTTINGQTWKAE
jgi:hypothetical protein